MSIQQSRIENVLKLYFFKALSKENCAFIAKLITSVVNTIVKANHIDPDKMWERLMKNDRKGILEILFMIYPYEDSVHNLNSVVVIDKISLTKNHDTLLDTIWLSSNKLMPNWDNVYPVPLSSIGSTPTFITDTQEGIGSGLWEGDYYNTLVHDLYWRVAPVTWMIANQNLKQQAVAFASSGKNLSRKLRAALLATWEQAKGNNPDRNQRFYLGLPKPNQRILENPSPSSSIKLNYSELHELCKSLVRRFQSSWYASPKNDKSPNLPQSRQKDLFNFASSFVGNDWPLDWALCTDSQKQSFRNAIGPWRADLPTIVHVALCRKGCLTQYLPIKPSQGNDAFHFMTTDTHPSKPAPVTFTAMDGLFQIAMYHHMRMNRMMLVTGSTGVGKSTQAPKLLVYGLKMLNIAGPDPCVWVSQPRQIPTQEITFTIRKSLFHGKDSATPFLRFSHSNAKKPLVIIDENNKEALWQKSGVPDYPDQWWGPHINTFTDGTLFEVIVGGKYFPDYLVIDEAHEHNVYMDLLTTLVKALWDRPDQFPGAQAMQFIIMSATLELDEPLYRAFFKDTKADLDCHFHIGIPGSGTRLPITEFYRQDDPGEKEYEAVCIETICKVIRQTTSGDLLAFFVRKKQTDQIVQQLNKTLLPPNVVAVPLYSGMPDWYVEMLTGDTFSAKSIPALVRRDAVKWATAAEKLEGIAGSFSRVVIVSTNIAEASVTLQTIRYVVDSGYETLVTWDFSTGLSKPDLQPISKSSRLQRKGRAGRVAVGEVYYVYSKGSRDESSNGKSAFKITTSDAYGPISKLVQLFDWKTLQDFDFYFIHPDEELAERDPTTYKTIRVADGPRRIKICKKLYNDNIPFIRDFPYTSVKQYLKQNLVNEEFEPNSLVGCYVAHKYNILTEFLQILKDNKNITEGIHDALTKCPEIWQHVGKHVPNIPTLVTMTISKQESIALAVWLYRPICLGIRGNHNSSSVNAFSHEKLPLTANGSELFVYENDTKKTRAITPQLLSWVVQGSLFSQFSVS